MKRNCAICGEPSQSYVLCYKHNIMKAKGEVEKCEQCGTWYETATGCPNCKTNNEKNNETTIETTIIENTETRKEEINKNNNLDNTEEKNSACIICGEQANGHQQCKKCYYEIQNYMDSLDRNRTVRDFRDYYYNLKERIVIINGIDAAREQCKKLIAIAIANRITNDDTSLIDRVYKDVETLLNRKKPEPPINPQYAEERKERDASKSRINTAQDGHNCDSDMEVRIDDILYNSYILHCYGKNIDEITEIRKKCDWFIPISNGKGIYIEYWGMEEPDYIQNRKEKEELYKKYEIPYIGIEKDDPKKDTQTFKSNLIRDLTTLAVRKYGFMPEWKK